MALGTLSSRARVLAMRRGVWGLRNILQFWALGTAPKFVIFGVFPCEMVIAGGIGKAGLLSFVAVVAMILAIALELSDD
jgi:hypothetical protein